MIKKNIIIKFKQKLIFNCIQSNIDDINTISKCNKIGGNITTEQKFIKHDRIMDLFHDKNIDNAMPIIIEYNYESKIFLYCLWKSWCFLSYIK